MAVLPTGNAAHFEQEFDSLDVERIESGFNEKIVGFSQQRSLTRKLENVVHTRNGSLVEQVRAVTFR